MLRRHRQIVRDQRVEQAAGEDLARVRTQAFVEHALEPDAAEKQQWRDHRERVVVELGGAEGEYREPDQDPEEKEEERAIARRLRAQRSSGEDAAQRSGKREHPGEAVEPELLDEVRERAARSARVDA